MAKIDVRQAYQNVPVHPRDRHILGMEWQGRVLIDGALPFGLKSAPLMFTALGDAVQWAVEKEGVLWAGHYIVTLARVSVGGIWNQAARADIEWWWQFSQRWNGVAMMVAVNRRAPECDVVSDTSGSWGGGAVFRRQWFQLEWAGLGTTQGYGVMAKPIIVAAAVWGSEWDGKTVRARCDNQSVVATVNSGTCRQVDTMHLRRCLAFLEARGGFHMTYGG